MASPSKSNPSSSSSPEPDTSYLNMTALTESMPDATLIGSHCEFTYCNQLDFLPFFCQSCRHTFCLDHRTETAHKCPNEGAWAQRRREAQLARTSIGASSAGRTLQDAAAQAKPCFSPSCKTMIGTSLVPGVHCQGCRKDYCLKHRLREDHDCAKVAPPRMTDDVNSKAKSALAKLRAWGSAKKEAAGRALPKPKPSTAAARMVAVNSLKKTAKGDDKLPAEKRVYLYVEAEAATTTAKIPKGQFFYSRDWVVGRVLDAAARSLQVENVNNSTQGEEDKLRVFHVEGGRILEFNEKVGSALASGNSIVLLRGIGKPPDLIEM